MIKKETNIIISLVALAVIFLFLYQYPWQLSSSDQPLTDLTPSLLVDSQAPGQFITIKQAIVPSGGFIVAHQDLGGRPGLAVGHSAYLNPGRNTSMVVVLDQPTAVGQSLLVTLFNDTNGDYQFTADDTPMTDSFGKTITKQLVIVNQELLNNIQ
jgi:hypothetical protein